MSTKRQMLALLLLVNFRHRKLMPQQETVIINIDASKPCQWLGCPGYQEKKEQSTHNLTNSNIKNNLSLPNNTLIILLKPTKQPSLIFNCSTATRECIIESGTINKTEKQENIIIMVTILIYYYKILPFKIIEPTYLSK